jgi:Arabinofuranosyltransferase N terminal/Arabinofuranosyltransferase A C terminal
MTKGPETPRILTEEPVGEVAPTEADEPAPDRPQVADQRTPRHWMGVTADGAIALLTWLVGTPLAVLLVHRLDLDPFSVAGVVMPVAVGALVGAVVFALVLRRYSDKLIGLAMGVYAAWIGLTLATAVHGTPYGYGVLGGDAGRFVAMAMKYMWTWQSADSFARDLPTEYPPLYPWIIGHVATLVDRPAWQLFGEAQIVVMSGALVVAYLMWRRLVGPAVAFTIVGLAPAVFNQPSKDYEFLALLVFAPWVLATFAWLPRARGGMHWLPAGLIGALLVLTYQAWLLYSALGLLLLIGLTLRATSPRRPYLLHLLGVALTAFVVASWYVVPFVTTLVTQGGQRVSDFWMSPSIVDRPLVLPFMQATPIAVVELVGLLGMIWYRRTTWWAQPLLLIVVGNYAYRILFLLKTVQDNHTGYLQYTETLVSMTLVTAGVLTTSEAAPRLWSRLVARPLAPPGARHVATSRERAVAVTGVVALVVWAAMQGWPNWVPGPRGLRNSAHPVGEVNRGTDAHAERLPDGTLTRFAPPEQYLHSLFPTIVIERVVTSELGARARPVVLAYDQRLFAFLPYYGYTSTDRVSANTLLRWDDRAAEIKRLAAITDPAQFAAASRNTAFGPIDVFVLRATGAQWRWKSVSFSPGSFEGGAFSIEHLPGNAVVAVRKS